MASTAIFMPQNGYLLAVRSKSAIPGLLAVQGLNSTKQDILITSFSQQAQVAHQISQTIGGPEYIFVFGDRLQDLQIGIVTYARSCANPDGNADSYKNLLTFYNTRRLKPGSVPFVHMTFAGVNLRGLLLGFSASADSSHGTPVIRGTLTLKGWNVTEST